MNRFKATCRRWGFQPLSVKGLTYISLLLAIELIFTKFQFGPSFLKIGLEFIPIAFIAWWFGPFWSVLTALIADPIGAFINGYPFFIGFTLSAVLTILIYSLMFYRHDKISIWRIIIAVLLITVIVNIGLNTWWTVILAHATTSSQISTILYPRLIKNILFPPVQILVLWVLMNDKALKSFKTKVFK